MYYTKCEVLMAVTMRNMSVGCVAMQSYRGFPAFWSNMISHILGQKSRSRIKKVAQI